MNSTATPVESHFTDAENGWPLFDKLENPALSKRSIASVADASTDDDAVVFVAEETGTEEEEEKGEKCDFIFSGVLSALRKLSLYVRQDTLSFDCDQANSAAASSPTGPPLPHKSTLPQRHSHSRLLTATATAVVGPCQDEQATLRAAAQPGRGATKKE